MSGLFSGRSRDANAYEAHDGREYKVFIYESEFFAMAYEAKRTPTTEIGGDLYGTFTHGAMPVIWLASGPGPHCQLNQMDFQQDVEFTTWWAKFLMQNYAVQYIGSWHSHHMLGLSRPSAGDVRAAKQYAERHHRQSTLEVIANHDSDELAARGKRPLTTRLSAYFYPDVQVRPWVPARFQLMKGVSPLRERLKHDELAFGGSYWQNVNPSTCLAQFVENEQTAPLERRLSEEELPSELQKHIFKLRNMGYNITSQKIDNEYVLVIDRDEEGLMIFGLKRDRGDTFVVSRAVYSQGDENQEIFLTPAEALIRRPNEIVRFVLLLQVKTDSLRRRLALSSSHPIDGIKDGASHHLPAANAPNPISRLTEGTDNGIVE